MGKCILRLLTSMLNDEGCFHINEMITMESASSHLSNGVIKKIIN